MARHSHCRLLPLVQVIQNEEWLVSLRTLVLGLEMIEVLEKKLDAYDGHYGHRFYTDLSTINQTRD